MKNTIERLEELVKDHYIQITELLEIINILKRRKDDG